MPRRSGSRDFYHGLLGLITSVSPKFSIRTERLDSHVCSLVGVIIVRVICIVIMVMIVIGIDVDIVVIIIVVMMIIIMMPPAAGGAKKQDGGNTEQQNCLGHLYPTHAFLRLIAFRRLADLGETCSAHSLVRGRVTRVTSGHAPLEHYHFICSACHR
jgi:hypothetical protein